ncbi:hypothetical protein EAT1b_2653 [Exiguobacterium sp. AT1b]|uniref:Uncharacterized protein n=1 Tax=Exiguobacterium sp. (strain ATCC BAA-1283 / AT1b) TaxID=360911 RepID=C4L4K6_EXISA|nr:DUF5057 domain-containing protein [Exiguobacterium sp. AT1b]ACQ71569.1 hypothetical protein EAT1b_2653 [Exiguobacterium sp. AT1b]
MRKLMHVVIIFILLFSFVPQTKFVEAQELPKYKVLYLRDAYTASNVLTQKALDTAIESYKKTLVSDLNSLNKLEIDFMTVKQFNATRFPMDGAYDAIVLGSSPLEKKYQEALDDVNKIKSTSNRSAEHDTTKILNDLTDLKLGEITDFYVKTGLPVYLHKDVTLGSKNVKQLSTLKEFTNVKQFATDQALISELVKQQSNRPLLANVEVTYNQQPLVNNTVKIKDNERKAFQFNYQFVNPPTSSTIVELYIDFNHNDRFDAEDKVREVIASSTNQLEFRLSRPTYTGPKNWMIVAKDTVTGRKDYKKGTFLYIDKKVEANILQLTAGTTSNGKISDYLSNMLTDGNGQYQFTLNNGTTSEFQSGKFDQGLSNNTYDMLIFGFQDSYNTQGSMNVAATSKVKSFSETGQGVMLTHDTIFRSGGGNSATSEWERQFVNEDSTKNISGQRIYTNIGYGAPQPTKVIEKVQDGIFTSYPYVLDDVPKAISTTHNQYFTLDLNDPAVTPWYNLSADNSKNNNQRSYGDASNHYYTYTKNNFTYSGAGHTNKFSVEDEKKIFINTMYRAFIGANHKPYNVIESVSDSNQSYTSADLKAGTVEVTAGQDVKLMWRPSDYDFQDLFLNSTITYNGKQVAFENLRNYEVKEFTIPAADVVADRPIEVKIETSDQRNAKVIDTFTINVKRAENVSDLIQVSRSIDPSTINLYETGTIHYQVQYPERFDRLPNQLGDKFLRVDLTTFTEKLPSQLEVVAIRDANGKEYPVTNPNEIKLQLKPDLYYERNGNTNIFLPNDSGNRTVKFEVVVRAIEPSASLIQLKKADNQLTSLIEYSKKRDHILDKHNDWDKELEVQSSFPDLLINIGAPYAYEAKIPDVTLQIGAQQIVSPTITDAKGNTFTNPKWKSLKWEIVDANGVAKLVTQGNNAIVTGLKTGTAKLRLTIDPGDKKPLVIAESKVNVISPPEQLAIPSTELYVGQTTTVTPKVMPETAQYKSVRYVVESGDSVKFEQVGNNLNIIGLKPGTTQFKATVDVGDLFGGLNIATPSTFFTIQVKAPSLSQTPSQLDLWVWDSLDEEKRVNEVASIQVTSTPTVSIPFERIGSIPSALTVTQSATGYELRANHGYGTNGVVTDIPIQTTFDDNALRNIRSNTSVVRVNEYPNQLMSKDMTINIGEGTAPRPPLLEYWPTTSTWRDYRMEIVSGEEYVQVSGSGKELIPVKPGVAKVEIYTTLPAGKPFEAVKDTFYVRIIQTNASGQDDDRY